MHRPWIDPLDLMPQGDPETIVRLPGSSLLGLYIRGVEAPAMLGIREDRRGHLVSCAITNEIQIDTSVPVQSNPRRLPDRPVDHGEA